ncbi:CoxG family protein [Halopenitus salinus]|jgi:carbon monoxide dehydrogenase subunit G|uniref:CoxG family protein n=1 Tax=Halopenitus salinus TaxID=1198295 RepID=A0ABD5UW79_9EURY
MTVRVSRTFEFDADPDDVWAFISDPGKRADVISVVESYDVHDDRRATWHISLPIPMVRSTIDVETREVERDPPTRVKFVGKSRALRVTGEHTIEAIEGGCRLRNEFVVEGALPGVETFFKRNFEAELDRLERELRSDLGLPAGAESDTPSRTDG